MKEFISIIRVLRGNNVKVQIMKTSKGLYSSCFIEYKLTDEVLKRLQHELLLMLIDVKYVCDKYNIDYMLSGGTMLGAIRHQGFIPWDDDIDIMMLRHEYEKFVDKFEKEFPEKYIVAKPLSNPRYLSKMVKIYKRGTTYIEIPTAGVGGMDMIFIDLFIIENVPAPGLRRKIKSTIYDFAFKASSVCIEYLYPSPIIESKAKQIAELSDYYKFRKRMGCVFAHVGGIKFYLWICERLGNQKKKTGWLGIPSGISYEKEIFPETVYMKLTTKSFCGIEVKVPDDYDTYLNNLYGNYMEIPPENKREYHVAYKIIF